MSKATSQKPDYLFYASLIVIVGLVVFLAMDRFKDTQISDYLKATGQKLLARIEDSNERRDMQAEYNSFLKKVEEHEINPAKVEQFISKMNNLDQTKDSLNYTAFVNILQSNLKEVTKPDTINIKLNENDKKWADLNKRLIQINILETKVNDALKNKSNKSYTFTYTLDSTLNIILDEGFKDQIDKVQQAELAAELKQFEKEKILKWEKEVEIKKKAANEIKAALEEIKAAPGATPAVPSVSDSAPVVPQPPLIENTVPAVPE